MTDCKKIAELIFSDVDKSTEYYEELYPVRELPEGARVTRFAPSPTGYLHFGGLYAGFASKLTADTTGGVFMLRIEDTDKKREVEDGVTGIIVPRKDYMAAADAIEKFIHNRELVEKMGKAGRERVCRLYNWDENVQQMISIYNKMA